MHKQGCEIEALGVSYEVSIQQKKSPFEILGKMTHQNQNKVSELKPRKHRVLNGVHCNAKPREITAIIGPSGAGKTSLLEIFAGRKTPQGGAVLVNQNRVSNAHLKKLSGFVTQNDVLFPLLTVEETLMFSAMLRLNMTRAELSSKVTSLIDELGLNHVSNTRIKEVSGGERRRVSIGVDVIHDPELLLLDEPTSGLDSSSAWQIVNALKSMSETRGRTVVVSIHQPGYRIVKLFSSVILMANGTVLYQGTVDELGQSMVAIGLQLPPYVNVLEHALESVDSIYRHGLFQRPQQKVELNDVTSVELQGFATSMATETMILTHRFSKNVFRTKELFSWRSFQMAVTGLVLGSVFSNVKDNLIGAREKVGLFAFILTLLLSSTEALPVFLQEKEIVMKEMSSGSYRMSSYAVANAVVYLPFMLILAVLFGTPLYWVAGLNPSFEAFLYFIGVIWMVLYTANSFVVCASAIVPNFIVGNSMISGAMGGFFLFSGYFISMKEIPNYWIFVHYLSLFKYPFQGFLLNEFSNRSKCLERLFGSCIASADDVLREEGYKDQSKVVQLLIMLAFILFFRLVFYVGLRIRCSALLLP